MRQRPGCGDGVAVAAPAGDGGETDADAAVSTATDGFGAGVPSGVCGGSVGTTVTGTDSPVGVLPTVGFGVGFAVGVATVATFRSPAPESARGTAPSKRKSSAQIP